MKNVSGGASIFFGWGVRHVSLNPRPVSDKKKSYFRYLISDLTQISTPYFRPIDLVDVSYTCPQRTRKGFNLPRHFGIYFLIASSKEHTQFLTRMEKKKQTISDQNGRNVYHIYD